MEVGRQAIHAGKAPDGLKQPSNLQRMGVADGVGDGELVDAHLPDFPRKTNGPIGRRRADKRANPGGHQVDPGPDSIRLRATYEAAAGGHRFTGGVAGVVLAKNVADCHAEGHAAAAGSQGAVVATLVEYQPGKLYRPVAVRQQRGPGNIVRIGHLRNRQRMDEAGKLDVAQTRRHQVVDQGQFLGGGHRGFLVLQPVARTDLVNADNVAHGLLVGIRLKARLCRRSTLRGEA